MLNRLQTTARWIFKSSKPIFPRVREVESETDRARQATGRCDRYHDFNLNKVSQLRGVRVLKHQRVGERAQAGVLPGEAMRVFSS